MKLPVASIAVALTTLPDATRAQTCGGVSGHFTVKLYGASCTYEKLLAAYTSQVLNVPGGTCMAGSTISAQDDFDAKLMTAYPEAVEAADAAKSLCLAMYSKEIPFNRGAGEGDQNDPSDLSFEELFFNGLTDWNDEVETIIETEDRSATSVLRKDASNVKAFYDLTNQHQRLAWVNSLSNFEDSSCTMNAAMCCWPKDRQANDNNGNCATPYDTKCVDKDPSDNTNLLFADQARGDKSYQFKSVDGFSVFPSNNNDGEGLIHCHGFAWSNDAHHATARYKGNNLFFVSMYDHMYSRGYVKNIPGMPMCGCLDKMPHATRADCTQIDIKKDDEWEWKVEYNATTETFEGTIEKSWIKFNSCKGADNRNNDLYAYAKKLYLDGNLTRHQFGAVGRTLTDDTHSDHGTANEIAKKGFTPGYRHNQSMWTKVAGRDYMQVPSMGREAFNKAFFNGENPTPIIMRICPGCVETHKRVFYRRITTKISSGFDLLFHILHKYHGKAGDANGDNRFGEDFSLHSTYEDAVSGANPWKCPNGVFDYNANFDGKCSPSGTTTDKQYTYFYYRDNVQRNVAYYINTPETESVQPYHVGNSRTPNYLDDDIGNPTVRGKTYVDGNTIYMTGGGRDIWETADQGHFWSKPHSGDVDVRVHVTNHTGYHEWSKFGIMLRGDYESDSQNVFYMLTKAHGIYGTMRQSKGKDSSVRTYYKTSPSQESAWLRIVKKGADIEFWHSQEGQHWTFHDKDQIFFPEDRYYVGLALTSHVGPLHAEGTFEDFSVETLNSLADTASSNPLMNIGYPLAPMTYIPGVGGSPLILTGYGGDIWGTSDAFGYRNTPFPGDRNSFTATMNVTKFDCDFSYGRAGIMIRDSSAPDAANVLLGVSGSEQGVVLQYRETAGAKTVHHNMVYVNDYNSCLLKLVKTNDLVTAYYKVNADYKSWIEIGSVELNLSVDTLMVGQAITSGTDDPRASPATLEFEDELLS